MAKAPSPSQKPRARNPQSAIVNPLSHCLPYGRAWIDDPARFKIGLWARQTGKSFYGTLEAVRDCRERKTTWVILSAGERQALEAMLKARDHDSVFHSSLAGYVEYRDSTEALLKQAEMHWPNGSRLLAIPANPNTARGYSANLLLDEFAFHEKPDEIWRAIYPSISNPLKELFKIRILSTPNGLGNQFAGLWLNGKNWTRHKLDVYEAVKAGLPLNIEELKEGLNDPEAWAQEYECQFLDASAVLLPYELIAGCESVEATVAVSPEWWATATGRLVYIGWDFARKRDLSVPWVVERMGDVLHTREVQEFRGMSTPDQVDAMDSRIRAARRVCLDYTGPGIGLGDELVKRFGEYNPTKHQFGKIELLTFTNTAKLELFPALRVAFEKRALRVPVSRAIREDLHSMQRVSTPSGNVTYRAPHSDDGHADRCTALALCLRAAGNGGGPFAYERIHLPNRNGLKRTKGITA
jgi:phage FluMu gp28-like protein